MNCQNLSFGIMRNGKLQFLKNKKNEEGTPKRTNVCFPDSLTPPLIAIPCRKCLMCCQDNANDWYLRCCLEAREYTSNIYVTLTYEQVGTGSLIKDDPERFIKNLRTYFSRKQGITGIRFFLCGEYGREKLRPHYHAILFNCPYFGDEKPYQVDKAGYPLFKSETLARLWGKGFCTVGKATDKAIKYVTATFVKSYFTKPRLPPVCIDPFVSMSKHEGIGIQYFREHADEIMQNDYIELDGKIYSLPRFYNRLIAEKIGKEEYIQRFIIPRQERAKAVISKIAEEQGISQEEVIERYRDDIRARIERMVYYKKQIKGDV